MKNLFLVILIVFSPLVYAKYYIGDWGYYPCCGTNCYFFWADIWDDNGTNNISDDIYLGRARRLSCGLTFRLGGTVDIDKILNQDTEIEFPQENNSFEDDRIFIYPNPIKAGEKIYLKNLDSNSNIILNVKVSNLLNQKQFQFQFNGNSMIVPDWLEKGIYQVVINSSDNTIFIQQRLVVE